MKKIITLCFLMALVCVKGLGQAASATWTLTSTTTPAVTGNITATTPTFGSGLSTTGTNDPNYGFYGTNWTPGNTAPVPSSSTKYFQFSVTPTGSNTLNITSLTLGYYDNESFFSDGLAIFYSTSSTFASSTQVVANSGQISTSSGSYTNSSIGATAASGQTLYFRVYFYYVSSSSIYFGARSLALSGTTASTTPTLSATTPAAFGSICTGATAGPNSFTITGSNLTTANVAVGPLTGYTFSTTSTGTYSASLSLTHAAGSYSQAIYVKFTPPGTGSYSGPIPISGGGATAINVAASGTGVNSPPIATSGAASSITYNSATVGGSLTAGCTATTAYGIEYNTTNGFANGSGTQVPSSNLSGVAFSSNLTGLAANTTYYFHAYATSSGGTTYGTQGNFITPALTYIDSWISMSTGSTNWCAGEIRTISVTVKNNGTATWTSGPTGVNFSYYWSNQSRDANSRILPFTTPGLGPLGPGQQQTITFPVTAPSSAGTYTLNFDLVKEQSCWFGDNVSGCSGPGNIVYPSASQTISQPITALSYPTTTATYCTGTAITSNSPTVTGGTATSYTISPVLPATLSINATTGVISGTPTATASATTYVVTAFNACGSKTANLNLTVVAGVSALNYTTPSPSYCIGTAITPNTVSSVTGGGTITYSASSLPAGLTINSSTGTISGTPTAVTASTSYTITATNNCSSTTKALTISVNAVPTGVSATATPSTVCAGSTVALTSLPNSTIPLLSQNFNSGLGSWTATNDSYSDPFGGTPANAAWTVQNDGYTYGSVFHSNDNSRFIISNSDAQGAGLFYEETITDLYSPVFSTVGLTTCSLDFYQYLRNGGSLSEAAVYISTNGGSSYTLVYDYYNSGTIGGPAAFAHSTLDLSAYVGYPSVKIAFEYDADYDWYWALDNINVTGSTPYTYAWTSNPVGFTAATQNTTTTPSVNTTFTVKITNSSGCSATANAAVTVNPLPTATISGTTPVCQSGTAPTITFTGATGTAPYTFTYNINGGTNTTVSGTGTSSTATLTAPTSTPGTYTYNLVSVKDASSTACSNTVSGQSATVTVNPLPGAAGTITGTSAVCQGSSGIGYSISAISNATSYTWSYTGTGFTPSGTTASITGSFSSSATSGNLTVKGTNSCGSGTVSAVFPITIKPNANAGTISGATPLCIIATPVTYTSNGDAGGTWTSSATGVATVNASTGAVTAVGAGTTNITYTVSTGCNAPVSVSKTLIVSPNATAGTVSGTTPLCIGSTTNYTISGNSSPGTWSSTATAVATVNASTGAVTAVGAGTTNITYTVSTGCNAPVSASKTLTVSPNATAGTVSGTTPLCTGTTATYTSDGNAGGTWTSTNTGVATVNASTGAVTAVAAGTTTISYTVTGCNVSADATFSLTVNPTPTASFTSSTYSSCAGTGADVVFSGTANAVISYTIMIQGGSEVPQTPVTIDANGDNVIKPSTIAEGTYMYKITSVSNGNGCTGNITPIGITTVTIKPVPVVADIIGPDYIALGSTGNYTNDTNGGIWGITNDPTGSASLTNPLSNPATVTVQASNTNVGTPALTYTMTGTNGCTTTVSKTIQVFNNTIARYRSIQDGKASVNTTWEFLGTNGWINPAPTAPDNNSNIEVRHNVRLETAVFEGTSQSSFSITSHLSGTTTIDGTLTIYPTQYFQSQGSVNFNGRLVVLKSSSEGTAAIGIMKTDIAGASNVQVERFTDGKPSANNTTSSRRAWRLITSPVTGQTIHQSWQENAASNEVTNAYGTLITGYNMPNPATAALQGYDFTGASLASSIKRYDFATNAWVQLPSPGTLTSLQTEPAYMLFVRGDRTIGANTNMSTTATLRSTGTLQQNTRGVTFTAGKTYVLVGNPYASAIDFGHFYTNSSSNNGSLIKDQFYSWNSTIGTYGAYVLVTHDGTNGYKATPDANLSAQDKDNYKYIPNGSGFFVTPASATTAGTISFHEEDKAPGKVPPINPFRVVPNATNVKEIIVNLNLKDSDTSLTLADGFRAKFSADYEGNEEDNSSTKLYNFNENLNLVRGSYAHIIEAHGDVKQTDTLYMKMWYVTKRNYQLQILGENWASAPGVHAYLVDNYLATKQEVTLSGTVTSVNFTVNTDSASWKSDRFSIVFQNDATVLPVTLTSVKAAAQNGGVNVTWTVTSEQNIKTYTVERSINGGNSYTAIGSQQAKNQTAAAMTNYQSFDAAPQMGSNLYRIRIETKEGVVTYSSVVTVVIGQDNGKILITLYPNPVRPNGKVSLQMSNLATGTYLVNVYSQAGQTVYQKKITISQANTTQSEELRLGGSLAQGSYEVRITNSKGEVVYADQLVVGR